MATARLILQGHLDGLTPLESQPLDFQWSIASAVGQFQRITLGLGDTTITVPTAPNIPRLIIIVPPATVLYAKVWKGAGGDTGTTMDRYLTAIFPYASGGVVINSAGIETSPHLFIFL